VSPFLPIRLAWRQLRAERARLFSANAGVMFACVLVFMQLGFRSALFDSATALPQALRGELFLVHPLTTAMFRPESFPRVRAYQTLAIPDVALAVPIYMTQSIWRNPVNGSHRAIQLIGFDTEAGAVSFPGLTELIPALNWKSRPEFGPVPALLAANRPLKVQIGNREVEIVGTVALGASFGADGNAVMSETNFRRIASSRETSNIDLVALRLRPGADPIAVQRALTALLPGDVKVVTHDQLVAWERNYWETATPIGFIFAFGSLMGLIVGMVIGASGILAGLGFVPGLLASAALYDIVAKATLLPLRMDATRGAVVLALIFAMCTAAGLLAMRKLRDADPADMF
jgi:putative ABC transport system permease protein